MKRTVAPLIIALMLTGCGGGGGGEKEMSMAALSDDISTKAPPSELPGKRVDLLYCVHIFQQLTPSGTIASTETVFNANFEYKDPIIYKDGALINDLGPTDSAYRIHEKLPQGRRRDGFADNRIHVEVIHRGKHVESYLQHQFFYTTQGLFITCEIPAS